VTCNFFSRRLTRDHCDHTSSTHGSIGALTLNTKVALLWECGKKFLRVLWRCATTILSNPFMMPASVYKSGTFVSLRTSKDKYRFMEFEKINAAPTNKPPLPPNPSYANTLKVSLPHPQGPSSRTPMHSRYSP